jgi:hypothetical protein
MPRYVILEHDHPSLHWDLMLEATNGLRTWRLAAAPQHGKVIPATATFDHRRMYLDYEGPVSGNRGWVRRWDSGTFSWQKIENDHLAVELNGVRLRGWACLRQASALGWTFRFGEADAVVADR